MLYICVHVQLSSLVSVADGTHEGKAVIRFQTSETRHGGAREQKRVFYNRFDTTPNSHIKYKIQIIEHPIALLGSVTLEVSLTIFVKHLDDIQYALRGPRLHRQ